MLADLRRDLRVAIRNLAGSPGFAAIAIVSLGIGIGATTTVFSVINTIMWKPLPYQAADEIVDVYVNHPTKVCTGCGVGGSYADYGDWAERARVFSGMGAYNEVPAVVEAGGTTERANVAYTTASALTLLGVQPIRGRWYSADDDRPGAVPVALIGERVWRARFEADPDVVGRTMDIDGVQHAIIGVMPERFAFPLSAQVWAPLAPVASLEREERDIGILGRLAQGRTLEDARLEMGAIGRQLQTEYPAENGGWDVYVDPLRSDMASDYVRTIPVMLGAVLFVLLIACANLAGLLLVRALNRRRELAVRAALGASRMALVRQLLAESLVLASAGGALGLLLAMWGIEASRMGVGEPWPKWMEFSMDWRVAVFALGVTFLTALAFGLIPALRASRPDVYDVLKDTGRGGEDGRGGKRLRNTLVVTELTLTLVLLSCAALFTSSAVRSSRADMGYDPARFVRADLTPPATRGVTSESRIELTDQLIAGIRTVPGVSSVAISSLYVRAWPGTPAGTPGLEGVTDTARAGMLINHVHSVTPDFFRAYHITLRDGRAFTDRDRGNTDLVAMVSRQFAELAWPGESAVGRQLRIGAAGDDPWRTVVGVIEDMGTSPLGRGRRTLVYLPYAQFPTSQPDAFALSLVARTRADEAPVVPGIRSAIQSVDPHVIVDNLMPMRAHLRRMSSGTRYIAWIAGSLATFALLLAAIGIYGVVAASVAHRRHEIGVRMALGALAAQVERMILRQAMVLTLVGLAIGIPASAAVARIVASLMFNTGPGDVMIYAAAGVVFIAVTLVAAWLPARRAAHVDPLDVLRTDH